MQDLAKSSGLTLEEHTNNVISEGKRIVESYPFVMEKYQSMTKRDLAKRLEGACKFHDVGKGYWKWQEACRKDYQVFLDWQKENGGDFNDFQKAVKNTGENLRRANCRHEIASVVKCLNLPLPIYSAIAAHHGKLSKYHESKWLDDKWKIEGSEKAWNKLRLLNNDYQFPVRQFRKVLQRHYEFAGVRGLLQLADVRASITENGGFIPPFIPFEYDFPKEWAKRPVQEIAEENWKDDLLLIRAPTGAGKTAASLLWANQQIKNNRADRLIIAMPTRFTSNALAISVKDDLSETGLYHSSAWFKEFHEKSKESKEAKHEAKMLHEFARKLLTPVTVCTIDHLLMCLTLSREDHHSIAFNLAHSCVVIDEADFYDDFTQANILVLLEALNEWKVPVMIMSASLPASSLKMYQTTGYKVREIKEDNSDVKEWTRHRCEVKSIQDYEKVDELSELLLKCTKQPAIIYANTVAKAIEFYDWFNDNTDIKPMLYHSRFTEPDKLEKEKVLIENLGSQAWKNGTANGVAILTQIGEMSINISADLMISDVCPIDRLVQRAGRLCRFDKEKIGDLHVIIPYQTKKEERNIYPAPYGSIEKRKWIVSPALQKTINLLKLRPYSAQDFVDFINVVYERLEDFSVRAMNNAKLLKKQFAYNWIVLPKANSELDDSETIFWKSRDIGNNETILTAFPENPHYYNYMDWQEFKMKNSVDLPIYLIQKGKKLCKIYQSSIFLKDEEIKVWRTHEDVYEFEKGLFFSENNPNIFL
jgi:CRISPR-associated endonuclease/helicase Cas3